MAVRSWIVSTRYVLSVPGTTEYRLRADESGFENLYLAGDWLRTGRSAGGIEGACMGRLQASRAISGRPEHIVRADEPTLTRETIWLVIKRPLVLTHYAPGIQHEPMH